MSRVAKILAFAVAAWVAVFAAACLWKYEHYFYTGIDLAYFGQVFWNTVHGAPFQQTIHPHLSLGDHAELAIPILAVPYALWQDPRMLLLLQALALALPAWPLYLIARRRLAGTALERLGPPAVAAAWLLNPAVQNVSVFEFHVLPFALAPLFFALLAYECQRKVPFVLWLLAALLVREDVALVVMLMGALALIERRPAWWALVPFMLGASWFAGAMRLISHFAPAGGYKFASYYAWLGSGPLDMVLGAVTNGGTVFLHVTTHRNLEMLVGLALPLLFLPFARPARLILALGPLLQIVLSGQGGGALVFQTHYATLFLPGFFLAGLEGLRMLPAWLGRRGLPLGAREAVAGFLVASVYGMAMMGPLPGIAAAAVDPASTKEKLEADIAISAIPENLPVAASYRLLPKLASRPELYSLHYQFLGVTQFAEQPYAIPYHVSHVAFDRRDLLTYHAQYEDVGWARARLQGGEDRLRAMFGEKTCAVGAYETYRRDGVSWNPVQGFSCHEGWRSSLLQTSIPVPEELPEGAALRIELKAGRMTFLRNLPVSGTSIPIVEIHRELPFESLRWQFQAQRAWYTLDDARSAFRQVIDVRPLTAASETAIVPMRL